MKEVAIGEILEFYNAAREKSNSFRDSDPTLRGSQFGKSTKHVAKENDRGQDKLFTFSGIEIYANNDAVGI